MDKYKNFAELEKNEEKEKDYTILYRNTDSDIAVMAPHGGGIEPGTLDLADEIAGKDFLFYSFFGIKKNGNNVLHIGSTRFDEVKAIEIACNVYTVVTIHGCRDKNKIIYTGGKDRGLELKISKHLTYAGFNVKSSQDNALKGRSDYNLCNRGRNGRGVQLEISLGLRQKMFECGEYLSKGGRTEIFYEFVKTVRGVLLSVHR